MGHAKSFRELDPEVTGRKLAASIRFEAKRKGKKAKRKQQKASRKRNR